MKLNSTKNEKCCLRYILGVIALPPHRSQPISGAGSSQWRAVLLTISRAQSSTVQSNLVVASSRMACDGWWFDVAVNYASRSGTWYSIYLNLSFDVMTSSTMSWYWARCIIHVDPRMWTAGCFIVSWRVERRRFCGIRRSLVDTSTCPCSLLTFHTSIVPYVEISEDGGAPKDSARGYLGGEQITEPHLEPR